MVGALLATLPGCMPPGWGAAALLHPRRQAPGPEPALPHRDIAFCSAGATLRGWRFAAREPRREAAVVYLHGISDTRASGTWLAERLVPLGFDVLAFDLRAHGASGGDACTYGVLERQDLARALDLLGGVRVVVVGVSLGGAVALQAAAEDRRIQAVVAAATFSDLESIARDRAPWFASERQLRRAFRLAEEEGKFRIAEASPVLAAPRVLAPVLLVHGAADRNTPPVHSERVFNALGGARELRLVPGARHAEALERNWPAVEDFILRAAATPSSSADGAPPRSAAGALAP